MIKIKEILKKHEISIFSIGRINDTNSPRKLQKIYDIP